MGIEKFVYGILLILGASLILFGFAMRRNDSSADPRDERLRVIQQKFRAVHQRSIRQKNVRHYFIRWGVAVLCVCLVLFVIQSLSSWPFTVTLRHIAAAPNCDMARLVGLAPASLGEPGYYNRHDGDSDGISCEVFPR